MLRRAEGPLQDLRLLTVVPLLGAAVAIWAVAALLASPLQLAAERSSFRAGVEGSAASICLFAALVLLISPAHGAGRRLWWVAGALLVLAGGAAGVTVLVLRNGPLLDLNPSVASWLAVRSGALALIVVGLVPAEPPRLRRRLIVALAAVLAALAALAAFAADRWPQLVVDDRGAPLQAFRGGGLMDGQTTLYWLLALVPLLLAVVAALAALRRALRGEVPEWLAVACAILAGSQLHSSFWPSEYTSVVTSSDILRHCFIALVGVGAVLELRSFARQRDELYLVEQARSTRLSELTVARGDFTRMISHELGSRLAAIRGMADMIGSGELTEDERAEALALVEAEVGVLSALATDLQAAAQMETDDFPVVTRPVRIAPILRDTANAARALPGAHPVDLQADVEPGCEVVADGRRIRQVLTNLVTNAAKYSPDGAPIELRAERRAGALRIAVVDHGLGIGDEEQGRIFHKFERGADRAVQRKSGVGLGLYLASRIVEAHGSRLEVRSRLGQGSVFEFELDVAG